jgi:hypothetical protein
MSLSEMRLAVPMMFGAAFVNSWKELPVCKHLMWRLLLMLSSGSLISLWVEPSFSFVASFKPSAAVFSLLGNGFICHHVSKVEFLYPSKEWPVCKHGLHHLVIWFDLIMMIACFCFLVLGAFLCLGLYVPCTVCTWHLHMCLYVDVYVLICVYSTYSMSAY